MASSSHTCSALEPSTQMTRLTRIHRRTSARQQFFSYWSTARSKQRMDFTRTSCSAKHSMCSTFLAPPAPPPLHTFVIFIPGLWSRGVRRHAQPGRRCQPGAQCTSFTQPSSSFPIEASVADAWLSAIRHLRTRRAAWKFELVRAPIELSN
jgi:hypothetical protein